MAKELKLRKEDRGQDLSPRICAWNNSRLDTTAGVDQSWKRRPQSSVRNRGKRIAPSPLPAWLGAAAAPMREQPGNGGTGAVLDMGCTGCIH